MKLRDYVQAVRAHWVVAVVALAIAVGVAGLVTYRATPIYASSTQLFVSTPGSADVAAAYQGNLFSQQRVTSYAELLEGDELASMVAESLDLNISQDEVAGAITASVIPDTVILQATVVDPSPERAQAIAEAVGSQFAILVAELETPRGADVARVTVSVVQQPRLPTTAVEPSVTRNLGLGALLGLIAGFGLAVLREQLDNTVKRIDEIEEVAGASVIGGVMYDSDIAKKPLARQLQGQSQTAEAFRQIRTNLQFLNVDDPPRVLVVTSSLPGEGKTTMAIGIALVLAQSGERVVLVEGDLRRPRVARYLNMVEGAGLTNVLAGRVSLEETLQPLGDGKLSVLASGPTPPNPSEMLGSSHMRQIISELRESTDYVIIDSSPLLPVTDGAVLAAVCDGVVLVTRHGVTKREQLRQSAQTLHSVDGRLLGVVLNMVPVKSSGSYGYGYGYGYEADKRRRHTESSAGERKKLADYDTAPVPVARSGQPTQERRRRR
jgi:receptor protein-tyrosine kinase